MFSCTPRRVTARQDMESERVGLVCLKNRMREVRLEPDFVGDACTTTPFSVELLVKAVRPKFSDLPCLTDNTSGSCSINPVIIVAGSRRLRSVFLRKMFSLFAQKMALSLTDIELLEEEQAPIASTANTHSTQVGMFIQC
jgi:hypothetical protein